MRGQTEGSHEEINVEEAIRIHGNMVYRLALVQMKNKSEAEDVFQEVFLRLVKYKERIQGREHLKAWLLRVTVNCCKKQFDSAFRKKTVSIDRDVQSTDSYEMDLPENLIYEAVLRLPADYRSTVHLFYYEQYSVSEIAEMLELSYIRPTQSNSPFKASLSIPLLRYRRVFTADSESSNISAFMSRKN